MGRKSSKANAALGMESFRERLKALGFKATPQRVAVHEAMLELVHASVDMVAGHIAAKGAPASPCLRYTTSCQGWQDSAYMRKG